MQNALPTGKENKVLYPDGTLGNEPKDNTWFADNSIIGRTFQWDGYLRIWVDNKGEIFNPEPKKVEDLPERQKKCECGALAIGSNDHYSYCELYA